MQTELPTETATDSLDDALDLLRDGIGTSYGDRVAPAARLFRVASDVYPDRNIDPIRQPPVEFTIWRYQHPTSTARDMVEMAVDRCEADPDSDPLSQEEIIHAIRVAAHRRREQQHPYDE